MRHRVAVLTSTAPRHRYFVAAIRKHFEVTVALHQPKKAKSYMSADVSDEMRSHFKRLISAEYDEFTPRLGSEELVQLREVVDINDPNLVNEVRETRIDAVCLFGTAILNSIWLTSFPGRIVNLHLGLSPFYRGTATLFWPFEQGELECVGTTIHLATEKVDAGAILRRIKADPKVGEDYYSLSNRLIRRSIDEMPGTVADFLSGRIIPQNQDFADSKLFRRRDFTDAALRRMLSQFGEKFSAEQIARAEKSPKCRC